MIMTKVYWTLGGRRYADYDEFVRDVSEYNNRIDPDRNEWNPNLVICKGPACIRYEAMWKDEDEFLDVVVESTEKPVAMGWLLFVLHNESVDFFAGDDHCFFEGLHLVESGTYWLHTGS